MGVASYWRGSRSIARGDCRARGCRGCSWCWEPPAPTPRPADWGSKARAKADKKAAGLVAFMRRRGQQDPSASDLADMIQMDTKIGRNTAEAAAKAALNGEPRV